MPGFDYSQSDALHPGYEFDYAQITSDVNVTGTSSGSPTTVIDGNSVIYDGVVRVKIEFNAALCDASSGNALQVGVWEDSTLLGRVYFLQGGPSAYVAAGGAGLPIYRVPTAGAHTYHVKAWKNGGTCTVYAASASQPPAFLRITKA